MNKIIQTQLLATSLLCLLPLNSALASTVNFADGIFNTISSNGTGLPTVFTESVDGVTLTLEATDNLVGGPRFLSLDSPSNGLHLAGGGGSTLQFTFSADTNITLDSYSTDTGGFFLGSPTFDVTGSGINSLANSLSHGNTTNLFNDGSLSLLADEVYTFQIQGGGAAKQAFIDSFEFTKVSGAPVPAVSGVPVPAASWLFISGLLGLVSTRRKQR